MESQILGTKPGIYYSVSTHLHLIIAKAQLDLLGWTQFKWQHWASHPKQTPCHPEWGFHSGWQRGTELNCVCGIAHLETIKRIKNVKVVVFVFPVLKNLETVV